MTELSANLPPWLSAKVDQRLALMMESTGGPEAFRQFFGNHKGVIFTPLTEPDIDATKEQMEVWDRACDNCGRYCPPGTDFYTGHVTAKHQGLTILMGFGACPECQEGNPKGRPVWCDEHMEPYCTRHEGPDGG